MIFELISIKIIIKCSLMQFFSFFVMGFSRWFSFDWIYVLISSINLHLKYCFNINLSLLGSCLSFVPYNLVITPQTQKNKLLLLAWIELVGSTVVCCLIDWILWLFSSVIFIDIDCAYFNRTSQTRTNNCWKFVYTILFWET